MMVPFTCFRQSIAIQALHITKLYQKYMDGSFQNSLLIWKPGRGSKGGGGTAVPGTDRISAKIEVKYVQISKKIIDERKTTWYVFLKKEIILKANLLKGRVAKPEGTKVRKLDHVSRLPLFPYHHNIWKRCLNRRDSDTFYTIQMCDFKKIQQGHWQILASVLFVCKNG